jgi:hypothetical protein
MKLFKFLGLMIATLFLFSPIFIDAKIGVGIRDGKIQIEEDLKSGETYQLPSFSVLNTGDEISDYEVTIEYQEKIPQLWPSREWFIFSPKYFTLEPGKIQNINITLSLPPRIQPGEYFAYLEGHPVKKDVTGLSSIGIAAASKLYFTVAPANNFESIYYFMFRILNHFMPWPVIILAGIFLIVIIVILRKKFSFSIESKKK